MSDSLINAVGCFYFLSHQHPFSPQLLQLLSASTLAPNNLFFTLQMKFFFFKYMGSWHSPPPKLVSCRVKSQSCSSVYKAYGIWLLQAIHWPHRVFCPFLWHAVSGTLPFVFLPASQVLSSPPGLCIYCFLSLKCSSFSSLHLLIFQSQLK